MADATRLDVLIKSRDDLKKTIENLITDLSGPLAPSEKSYKEELLRNFKTALVEAEAEIQRWSN